MNILIVEDDINFINLVRRILPNRRLYTVDNSIEAYRLLHEIAFDVVLLDLDLPDSDHDGFKILEHIDNKHKDIIVIVVTADDRAAQSVLHSGAWKYLLKNGNIDHMRKIIQSALRKSRHAKKLFSKSNALGSLLSKRCQGD